MLPAVKATKPPKMSGFVIAGVPGLEPRTKDPETFVLPITPYPRVFFGSDPTLYLSGSAFALANN